MLSEVDDTRFLQLMEAQKAGKTIQIFGLMWRVLYMGYAIEDECQSIARFDLEVADALWDGVSKHTVQNGIQGTMSLSIRSILPNKWDLTEASS